MDIRFRPVSKIRRMINGRRLIVFTTGKVYDGILNDDKTVTAYCYKYHFYVKIGVNDYMVEH